MIQPVTTRGLAIAAAGVAAALALGGCGSSHSGAATPPGPSATPTSAPSGSGSGRQGQFGPAASGEVAAISGTTMQVQSQQNGQVAVAWTTSTKFSHTVTTTLAAIKAGDCVIATAASGTASSASSFTASTVVLSNSCGARGFGSGQRPNGQRPSGFPSNRPSNFPSNRPSGAAGRNRIAAFADGKVSSVSGSTLVIASQQRQSGTSKSTTKKVTVGSSTKITTDATTTSHSVVVGKCVTAQGKADSTGTVTATSVQITDPTNGRCSSGFGGFGGGFGRGRNGG
jgi:hypothetical protein